MRIYDSIELPRVERNANPFWRNTKTEKHRGGQQKAWNQSQIDKSNTGLTAAKGYGAAAAPQGSYLTSKFEDIAANPISDAEKAGRLSSVGSAYDALGEKAGERMARTRNSAGYGSLLDDLARGKAKTMDETTAALGEEGFKRKMAALGGVGNLYGTNVGAQTHLLSPGSPNFQPGFWDRLLNNVISGGATVGAAALQPNPNQNG